MNISEWLAHAASQLTASGCPDPQIDARWMAEDTLGMSRTELKFESDRAVPAEALDAPEGEGSGSAAMFSEAIDSLKGKARPPKDTPPALGCVSKCWEMQFRVDLTAFQGGFPQVYWR